MYDVRMEFTKPKALKKGDVIGVFAPSDWFYKSNFDKGLRLINSWGLRVKIGKHVYERIDDFMAGKAAHRIEDLREMIFDDAVGAIWAAEGGYAATEIRWALGEKEFSHLRSNPKWLIGYSDVTVLTNAWFSRGLMSVMGANIWGLTYWDQESRGWIKKLLFGEEVVFPETGRVLIEGRARGRLLASNMDSLSASLGTRFDPILHGDDDLILLVEDWKQNLSTLMRQFEAIFDHERFGRIKGVILGKFSLMMEESYPKWAGKTDLGGLIKEKLLLRKKIPLVIIDYVGHPSYWHFSKGMSREVSLAVPNGVRVLLVASEKVNISCLERACS